MKIFLGVILLRTAWQYRGNFADDEVISNKQESFETDGGQPSLHKRRNVKTTDVKVTSDSSKQKFKSLSDIERFTLCSNRIV